MPARASRPSAYAFRCTSSYLIERHRRSIKMLSMKRPRPSIEIATLAASSLPVNAALVNCAAGPIDDRHEIQKAVRHRDIGDVGSPHVVRLGDRKAPQQVGIYLVSRR